MALRNRRKRQPERQLSTDPADQLAAAIGAAGCAICGETVFPGQGRRLRRAYDDPAPGWALHNGVCARIGATLNPHAGDAAPEQRHLALAFLVDPDARPVVVDQAVVEVAATLGVPMLWRDVADSHYDHRGHRTPWAHIPKAERWKLTEAVTTRRAEIAAAAARMPCSLCGIHPVPEGPSRAYAGGRACPDCTKVIDVAAKKIGGVRSHLDVYGLATSALPEGRMFVEVVVPAARHGSWGPAEAPRQPWEHLRREPIPKSPEERLAELEARVGASA